MKQKTYQKPAIKVLDTYGDELMFEIGGGLSVPNPETPSVGNAKEFDNDAWSDNAWGIDGSWDSDDEEC